MIIDYPWYTVVLCLLAGIIYAGIMYFVGRHTFSRGLRWTLASLRFLAVSIIALLLLAPVLKQTVHERQKPLVVLIDDCSESVKMSADSAFTLESLHDELDDNCRIILKADQSNINQTDLGAMLDVAPDAAAIVLASDGINNRGQNPVTVAEHLAIPVYTVALGDTTPQRDAALTDLRCNRIAMLGGRFPVEITVGAHLLRGHNATLTITDATGRTLHSQKLAYDADDYSATINATLSADHPGLQRYSARLTVSDNEVNTQNNVMTFYIDVIDARRKVAIYANAPHPDLGALKRAIESNPNFEAEIILAESGKQKAANDYSLAILHNLPSQKHPDVSFAKGLPTLYIIGTQTDLGRFNALHSGLEIVANSNKTNEVTALHRNGFSLFQLDAADATVIEAMPPLYAPFGEARIAADVQTLFGARLANIDMRQPLIAATAQGEERRAFIWGEGLWRWRLADWQANESHEHFDRLLTQLVGFTAMQQQRQRLQVTAERRYAEGETPVLRAQLYNENYELTNDPEVKLHLRGDSADAEYAFLRDGNSYRLALPPLKEGLYRYTASTADGLTDDGSFAVEALNLEQRRLVADHTLLRTISAVTGSEMYYPENLSQLTAQLSSLKPTIYTHIRYAEYLRLPLVLLLIILLLGAEWVLRKYHGEL